MQCAVTATTVVSVSQGSQTSRMLIRFEVLTLLKQRRELAITLPTAKLSPCTWLHSIHVGCGTQSARVSRTKREKYRELGTLCSASGMQKAASTVIAFGEMH